MWEKQGMFGMKSEKTPLFPHARAVASASVLDRFQYTQTMNQ